MDNYEWKEVDPSDPLQITKCEVQLDWDQVAWDQFEDVFSKVTDAPDEDHRLIADIYNEETIGCIVGTDVTNVFEPLHSPLEDILLSFYNFDGLCRRECYVLTQKGEETEIQTPRNRFNVLH